MVTPESATGLLLSAIDGSRKLLRLDAFDAASAQLEAAAQARLAAAAEAATLAVADWAAAADALMPSSQSLDSLFAAFKPPQITFDFGEDYAASDDWEKVWQERASASTDGPSRTKPSLFEATQNIVPAPALPRPAHVPILPAAPLADGAAGMLRSAAAFDAAAMRAETEAARLARLRELAAREQSREEHEGLDEDGADGF